MRKNREMRKAIGDIRDLSILLKGTLDRMCTIAEVADDGWDRDLDWAKESVSQKIQKLKKLLAKI